MDTVATQKSLTEAQTIAGVQGAYFAVTGIWPLVSYRTFEKVTGPKKDNWLVKTVGVVIGCIGATLLRSALRNAESGETRFLALSSALGLIGIDSYFAATGRISKVYLLDAVVEATFVAAWLNERNRERR